LNDLENFNNEKINPEFLSEIEDFSILENDYLLMSLPLTSDPN